MPRVIHWFVHNPVASNLLMMILVVGGLLALPRTHQEEFPTLEVDAVSIRVAYLGAAPTEVESAVCVRIEEAIEYTRVLHARGCDFVDVSSGGNSPLQEIQVGPGYQCGFAAAVKREVPGMTVMAVGKITDPHQAEHILHSGQADMVALARGITFNTHWAWEAAHQLGDERAAFPPQYARSLPSLQGLPIPGNPPPAK